MIKKGSIIREYKCGLFIESEVITDVTNERGQLEFTAISNSNSLVCGTGKVIEYIKHESSLSCSMWFVTVLVD